MTYKKQFHNWLLDELIEAQMTQAQLAKLLKVPQPDGTTKETDRSVVCNWITGRYVPTPTRIMLIVEVFGKATHHAEKLLSCMQSIINSIEHGRRRPYNG